MLQRAAGVMLVSMKFDLHTHTTASDGQLSPAELMSLAAERGLDALAITDHDSTAGLAVAYQARPAALRLIPGIELSTAWGHTGVHVIGLGIDVDAPVLRTGIAQQQQARNQRAELIAKRLAGKGLKNTLAGARGLAGAATLGRPHFARYLASSGQVRNEQEAFSRYLGRGKIGDVRHVWAPLNEIIRWILDAGGIPVLAHPARYGLSNLKLEELIKAFRSAGGLGMEVVSGAQEATLTQRLGQLANRHELAASCGSDFHRPGQGWSDLGSAPALPRDCTPVWNLPAWRAV